MVLKLISIGIVVLLFYGLSQRFRPKIHIPVMLSAFVLDVSLVLYIELTRDATGQAMGWSHLPGIMKIHIFLSTMTVVMYLVQIVSGFIRFRKGGMPYHKHTGILFMIFRLGNLITSFLIETSR
ncbi:MAG: hypothetical protein KC940_06345 [Candidatus Omnitrophica bacterium]|nr:hypothetical protein [Candidatus Omnitrophota bacterium]MCB9768269.1 hypothetical protein [Candidatus Omnitrophota bacterium]